MIEAEENKEYLPIEGLAAFRKATLQLLLGSGHPAVEEVSSYYLVSPVQRSTLSQFLSQPSYPDSPTVHARMCSNTVSYQVMHGHGVNAEPKNAFPLLLLNNQLHFMPVQ